ncbi:MAG TPA: pitrilysin family protein [Thermoplasmata archaeon]|jgi:zinc protease
MSLPDRTVLDNGAVLIAQPLPSNPFVAFRGSVPAGLAAEANEPGLATFVSHLLLSGTRRMGGRKLVDRLESLGATLEFHAMEEVLLFQGRCTRRTAVETVRILLECLFQPAFPPKEVERVRAELLNELRIQRDDTRYRAARGLANIVFPKGHPYGREPRGDASHLKRIRRPDVVAFHEAHIGSDGLILAITGDVDRVLVEEAVARSLSKVPATNEPPASIPPPAGYRPRTESIPMPHKSQVDIAVGGPAVPRRHGDFYALHLANLLFGRIGLMGRIGRNLRDEQGLAYYAFSDLDARSVGGMWSVAAGVNPANLEKVLQGVRAEMERLRAEPFGLEEIRDGKDNQVGSLIVSLERNAEVAAELHRMEYFGLGMDFLEHYADIVRELPDDAVRSVAQKYFAPADASVVVAGPLRKARVSL